MILGSFKKQFCQGVAAGVSGALKEHCRRLTHQFTAGSAHCTAKLLVAGKEVYHGMFTSVQGIHGISNERGSSL